MLAWLVASLCPTSAVRLKTQYCDQTPQLVVAANDWAMIPDDHLVGRVGCDTARLFPLRSVDGELLGRVGIARSEISRHGSIVYQGVVCGRMKGLVGVVQARANNDDARRVKALPAGSTAEWKAWAYEILFNSNQLLLLDDKLRMHPLLPDRDLAVWVRRDYELPLLQLIEILSKKDEVLLHEDAVSHDSADDVSADRFSRLFSAVDHLVCVPSMSPRESIWDLDKVYSTSSGPDAFPWFLDVPPINYLDRFQRELTAQWGAFEANAEDDQVVGDVHGIEITRSVTRYRRSPPSA